MPVAEITAGITSLRAMMDIAKAMVGLRDAETFRSKSIEMQSLITAVRLLLEQIQLVR